jgi:rod shape-determining protein MreD
LSPLWLRQLDAHLRALLPLATAGLAALVDVVPLLGSGAASLTSFSTLCVVFFWSLYRPDLLTPAAAFLVGLIHDGLAGLPLGLTSLLILLVRQLVVRSRDSSCPAPSWSSGSASCWSRRRRASCAGCSPACGGASSCRPGPPCSSSR